MAAARRVAELVRNVADFARRNTWGRNVLEVHAVLASNRLKQLAQPVRQYAAAPRVFGVPSQLRAQFLRLRATLRRFWRIGRVDDGDQCHLPAADIGKVAAGSRQTPYQGLQRYPWSTTTITHR
jgi:hypothetical protein